jgi:hypothetical protein
MPNLSVQEQQMELARQRRQQQYLAAGEQAVKKQELQQEKIVRHRQLQKERKKRQRMRDRDMAREQQATIDAQLHKKRKISSLTARADLSGVEQQRIVDVSACRERQQEISAIVGKALTETNIAYAHQTAARLRQKIAKITIDLQQCEADLLREEALQPAYKEWQQLQVEIKRTLRLTSSDNDTADDDPALDEAKMDTVENQGDERPGNLAVVQEGNIAGFA